MKWFALALVISGFCLGTLGAAAFKQKQDLHQFDALIADLAGEVKAERKSLEKIIDITAAYAPSAGAADAPAAAALAQVRQHVTARLEGEVSEAAEAFEQLREVADSWFLPLPGVDDDPAVVDAPEATEPGTTDDATTPKDAPGTAEPESKGPEAVALKVVRPALVDEDAEEAELQRLSTLVSARVDARAAERAAAKSEVSEWLAILDAEKLDLSNADDAVGAVHAEVVGHLTTLTKSEPPLERLDAITKGVLRDRPRESARKYPLLVGGLVMLIIGGVLTRRSRALVPADAEQGARPTAFFKNQIAAIRTKVTDFDARKDSLDPEELREAVGELMATEFFDLTSRHEELVALVGFTGYARVWEQVAACERLLNRYWSMATDGFHEEAVREIDYARQSIDRAHEEMQAL